MPNSKIRIFKILKGEEIIVRWRGNVFDVHGRPSGNSRPIGVSPEFYISRFVFMEDFYNLIWVKEIETDANFKSWFMVLNSNKICANFKNNRAYWFAVLEKGELALLQKKSIK